MPRSKGSPTVYMVVTGLVLFFVPFLNGLFGGVAGGFRATSLGRALSAALAASIVVPAVVMALFAFGGAANLHSLMMGLTVTQWAALHAVGQLGGAAFGYAVNAEHSHLRQPAYARRRPTSRR